MTDIREALFRPSGADRWLNCPGSVQLSMGMPKQPPGRAAKEGTAAHRVAEDALKGIRHPDEYTDRWIVFDPPTDMKGHPVDAEMAEGVQWYVERVRSRVSPMSILEVEKYMSLAPLDPSNSMFGECRGTADAVVIDQADKTLRICDLKYGKGIQVPADSPQLKIYALMGMLTFDIGTPWRAIETVILQPRGPDEDDRERSVWHDPLDLWSFAGQVAQAMHNAVQPNPPLIPDHRSGAKNYCRWCPAKEACPALAREAVSVAEKAFAVSPLTPTLPSDPLPSASAVPTLPDPALASADELAAWLEKRAIVENWFSAVEQRACRMWEAGVDIPGWKMVEKTTRRRWVNDPSRVKATLVGAGVKESDLYDDPKMKSPAQIEKLLPKDSRDELLKFVVEKPKGELVLVRSSDHRESVRTGFSSLEGAA